MTAYKCFHSFVKNKLLFCVFSKPNKFFSSFLVIIYLLANFENKSGVGNTQTKQIIINECQITYLEQKKLKRTK